MHKISGEESRHAESAARAKPAPVRRVTKAEIGGGIAPRVAKPAVKPLARTDVDSGLAPPAIRA